VIRSRVLAEDIRALPENLVTVTHFNCSFLRIAGRSPTAYRDSLPKNRGVFRENDLACCGLGVQASMPHDETSHETLLAHREPALRRYFGRTWSYSDG